MENVKAILLTKINQQLEKKINELKSTIKSAIESRDNKTKSSVGNKYETSRTILQYEVEKNQLQLQKNIELKNRISTINLQKKFLKIEYGALIQTNHGYYFIAIPVGKILIGKINIFCISPVSPIGILFMQKNKNQHFQFQGKTYSIIEIL